MLLPLALLAGAGVAALFVAGDKEAKSKSSGLAPAGTATNTVASTNGDNGGASIPSHADVISSAPTQPVDTAPVSDKTTVSKADAPAGSLSGTFPTKTETGQESAFQPTGSAFDSFDALKSLLGGTSGVNRNVESKAISASADLGTGAAGKVW